MFRKELYLSSNEHMLIKEVAEMPGRDQTGPFGRGPMTGHRRGYCADGRKFASHHSADFAGMRHGSGAGRGYFCRHGRGGDRHFAYTVETAEFNSAAELKAEQDYLQAVVSRLEAELSAARSSLSDLKAKTVE